MQQLVKLFELLGLLFRYRHSAAQFLRYRAVDEYSQAGSVSDEELGFLRTLIEAANELDGPLIEVGTLFGFTTQKLAQWKDVEKPLITIDNFRWNPIGISPSAHQRITRNSLAYVVAKSNVQIFEGANTAFYENYEGSPPAFCFIDAGHSYEDVITDIRWAQKLGIQIITGHDYSEGCPGVIKAVNEAFPNAVTVKGTVWAVIPDSVSLGN